MEPRHKDVAQTETRHRHEQTVLDPVVDIRGKIAKDILKIDELETNGPTPELTFMMTSRSKRLLKAPRVWRPHTATRSRMTASSQAGDSSATAAHATNDPPLAPRQRPMVTKEVTGA